MTKDNFEKYFEMAVKAQEEEDFETTLKYLDKALEIEKDNIHCLFSKAMTLGELGRNDEAITLFTNIINRNEPEFSDFMHYAYYSRGLVYDSMDDTDRAIKDFSKSISINPDIAEAYYQRAVCLFDIEDNINALDDLDKAIEIEDDYFEAFFARGHVYVEMNEFEKAVKDFSKIIRDRKDDPDNSSVYLSRAMCFYELEEFEKALKDLNDCIEINPEEVEAYEYRSNVYEKLGEFEKAKADMKKFEELMHKYQL